MRTLILTCNTGQGHNSSAAAVKDYFDNNGEFCCLCDSLKFSSGIISGIIAHGHVYIYRHMPGVFDKGYTFSESHGKVFRKGSLFYKIITVGAKKLYKYITENEIDTIVCVHPFAAMLVGEMNIRYKTKIRTALVATDYTCVPATDCSDMDMYFVPHRDVIPEFTRCGIPEEKIYVSGIPIRQEFFEKRKQKNDSDFTEFPRDKKVILMCCGSMGCGPMKKLSEKILENSDGNTFVTAICGNNSRLYKKLSKKQSDNFMAVGYTDRMCDYMRACDVFLTKPGGVSTTEAAVLGTPMFFVNAVGGCEMRNFNFFKEKSCAFTAESNRDIPKAIVDLLGNSDKLETITENLNENFGEKNSAEYIYTILKNL